MKRTAKVLAAVLACSMIAGSASTAFAAEVTSSKDTLVIAVEGTISHLDAREGVVNQSQNVYSIVGESLLKEVKNEAGLPVMTTENSITESYEVDDANSAIIFHLKQGVPMQDGTELNADDVVCSVQFAAGGSYYADIKAEEVKAVDDYTVSVGVKQVGMPVINKVAGIPIFSKEAYEEVNNEGLFFTED